MPKLVQWFSIIAYAIGFGLITYAGAIIIGMVIMRSYEFHLWLMGIGWLPTYVPVITYVVVELSICIVINGLSALYAQLEPRDYRGTINY